MGLFNPRIVNTTRVEIPIAPELQFDGTVAMTITCWVRLPSGFNQDNWAALITHMDVTWRVSVIGGNDYGWHWVHSSQDNITHNNNDDILHHFAFVKRLVPSTQLVQYRDGVPIGSPGGTGSTGSNANPIWISNNNQSGNRALRCTVMDMRIYDRALSPEEIQTIAACRGTDGIVNGMLTRWQFQDGAQGTLVGITKSLTGKHNGTGGPGGDEPEYVGHEVTARRRVA